MAELTTSLICSTYNAPRLLALVLESLRAQTEKNFELIIADDGSGPETKALIESYKTKVDFSIVHLWHEKPAGVVEKAKIHNVAVKEAKADLLIFIDGDCPVSPDFIADHLSVYRENKGAEYLFMGRRVELGPEFSAEITPENLSEKVFGGLSFAQILSALRGDTRSLLRRYSVKNPLMRRILRADAVPDLLGSNFSLPRSLMLKVNGFNEDCRGYGGEDGDLFIRVRNTGARLIGKKYFAVQFHVWHPRRKLTLEQEQLYTNLLNDRSYIWTERGIVK